MTWRLSRSTSPCPLHLTHDSRHPLPLRTVEEQLAYVCSSGRPFVLVDVKLVDEAGADIPTDSDKVGCPSPGAEAGARGRVSCA